MKKIFISILVTLLLLISLPTVISGAEANGVLEVPEVRIIMDGKLTVYKDVPISTGQRTLLPLREMLVNLGVPNDDEHIIYNELEKSVIVLKDQTRIYLIEGNQIAYVNEQPITLDAAPVLYKKNQRMYIPLRFVAEALDKKVVWDGSSNSIYICDASEFEKMKELLGKVDEAMKLTVKCRQTMDANADAITDANTDTDGKADTDADADATTDANTDTKSTSDTDAAAKTGSNTIHIGIHVDTQIDKAMKKMSMGMSLDMFGMTFKSLAYYVDQTSYIKDILTQKWQKKIYQQSDYDNLFESQSDITVFSITDSLCAGLMMASSTQSKDTGSESQATGSGDAAPPTEGTTLLTKGTIPPAEGTIPPTEGTAPPTERATPDEIILQGDVFLTDMFNRALTGKNISSLLYSLKNIEFEAFNVKLSIDPDTKLISSISMNISIHQKNKDEDIQTYMNIQILYSEYNGGFEIIIPEDVLKNTAELKQNV